MFGFPWPVNSQGYQVAVTICQSLTSLKATINMVWHPTDALRRLLFTDRNLLRIKLIENKETWLKHLQIRTTI